MLEAAWELQEGKRASLTLQRMLVLEMLGRTFRDTSFPIWSVMHPRSIHVSTKCIQPNKTPFPNVSQSHRCWYPAICVRSLGYLIKGMGPYIMALFYPAASEFG
jgi:hypothetical protein